MPAESICFIQVANSWPYCTVCFELGLELPLCLSSSLILANGPTVWVDLHNLQPEPITLNAGHWAGTIEAAEVMEPTETTAKEPPAPLDELVRGHLSPVQQHQLVQLLEQYQDIFSRSDEYLGQTPVLEHIIEARRPPVTLPYRFQNPTMRREEAEHLQQMLDSGIIRLSNSLWASPVVMVRKNDWQSCDSVSIFDSLTQPPLRMCTPCLAEMTC